jgi:hypothetical protein
MPNRLLTRDEVYVEIDALFERMGLKPPQRAVSDGTPIGARIEPPVVSNHVRAACDHCWHTMLDVAGDTWQAVGPRVCCWCGAQPAPRHGPYAPEPR